MLTDKRNSVQITGPNRTCHRGEALQMSVLQRQPLSQHRQQHQVQNCQVSDKDVADCGRPNTLSKAQVKAMA